MKNKILSVLSIAIITIIFSVCLPTVKVRASGDFNFIYNQANNCLEGQLTTSDRVTRLEIYTTSEYDYLDTGTVTLLEVESGTIYYASGENILVSATQTQSEHQTDVVYGGVVPVPEYGLNCLIYYVVSDSTIPLTWNISLGMKNVLTEAFVTKSTVPPKWKDSKDNPVITMPTEFCLGFINSKGSLYTSEDIKQILTYKAVEVEDYFNGEKYEEEQPDPVKKLLVLLIVFISFAIIITGILIFREKKKSEKKRSDAFVKNANAKVKEKKKKENEDLKDMMEAHNDEYSDEFFNSHEDSLENTSLQGAVISPVAQQIMQPVTNQAVLTQTQGQPVVNQYLGQQGVPTPQGAPFMGTGQTPYPVQNPVPVQAPTYVQAPGPIQDQTYKQHLAQPPYQSQVAPQNNIPPQIQNYTVVGTNPMYQGRLSQTKPVPAFAQGGNQPQQAYPAPGYGQQPMYSPQMQNGMIPPQKKMPAFVKKPGCGGN